MGTDSLQLSQRDIALLRGLFESRAMTMAHATALYFDGRKEAGKKRLQRIKAAGLVSERPRRSFEPSVLYLTRQGLEVLQKHGVLAQYPAFSLPALDRRSRVSPLTISHELEVMDVKAAFHAAIKAVPTLGLEVFSTWPLLNEFKAYRPGLYQGEIVMKPDGFVRIIETLPNGGKSDRSFFLEVDRSTEVQEKLVEKADCYCSYYKSGGFAVRNGGTKEDYKSFPFRVLMIFKTAERRNNTIERLLLGGRIIPGQICFSTIEEVCRDPLGSIWVSASEYRKAISGSAFDLNPQARDWKHRRNAEREAFLGEKLPKFSLLE